MKRCIMAGIIYGLILLTIPAVSTAGVLVYMPMGNANEIVVVDADKGEVVARISGVINSHGLAVTPDGSTIVAGSLTELANGELPVKPEQMSSDEHRAHHGRTEQQQAIRQSERSGILYLIDVKQSRILNQIRVPDAVHHNAITPDGKYAISTHPTAGLISVVDIELAKVVKTIRTGSVPNYAVANRDGSLIYISNSGNNTVSEVDTKSWMISRQLPAGDTPSHMALSPDEKRLYVTNEAAGKVLALDLSRGEVVKSYAVGTDAHGLALSHDGRILYASSKKKNRLVKVDLTSLKQQTLHLSPAPYHVAVIPEQNTVYVSSRKEAKIWVVDPVAFRVLKQINLKHGMAHQMVSVTGK
ncbi:MAG: beta-propeller fold lactonase family protein [Mariprofundaceae bacterium]|nr:beta-propeller fold lactonase family protein [Mariprofundaceae bacterium]